MRKLSAHYIFTGTGKVLNKGIIRLTDQGVIDDITDTNGTLDELAGVEFYSGILTPGFINTLGSALIPQPNRLLFAHDFRNRQEDIGLNLQPGSLDHTWFVLCPESNLSNAEPLPDLEFFRRNKLKMCLGSDSRSLNRESPILEALKVIHSHYPMIPFGEMVTWATRNGAEALAMNGWAGTIEVGKRPGINLITGMDLQHLQLQSQSKVKKLITRENT